MSRNFDEAGAEPRAYLRAAYRRVGTKCRQVIKSHVIEDRPLAETAEISGYSGKTVWKRLQECLKRMRLCLES